MAELHFFQLFKKKCIFAIFNTMEMRAIMADLVQNAVMTYYCYCYKYGCYWCLIEEV